MSLEKAGLMAYSHGNYYEMGNKIGKFGWSVMKEKTRKRLKVKGPFDKLRASKG
jgi:hypothetical protein